MPSTYSINLSTSKEAHRLDNVTDVLLELPDNIDKEINPHNLRDVVYSVWENSIFKQTIGSSFEYVGIDRDDINNKIYFGKKYIGSYQVMTQSLLSWISSDVDVFFFNTKSDYSLSSQDTKISILAGTNSSLYSKAPYITAKIATGLSSSKVIQFQIGNTYDINMYSNSNRVRINGLGLPTILETIGSASNNSILVYNSSNTNVNWQINTYATSSVGTSSSLTSLLGNPVTINGYDIELTSSSPIITPVGSIGFGKTFSKSSIVDVLREMLYTYIPPSCGLTVSPSIIEKGNIGTPIIIGWTIYKRTDPIQSALFSSGNVIGYTSPVGINPSLSSPPSTIVSSPPFVLGVSPATFSTTYTYVVKDTGVSNNSIVSTATSSVSINLVYPYFWGVNSINATNPSQVNALLGNLKKSVVGKSDKTPAFSGTGYIYFVYPVASGGDTYGHLSSIQDENGATVSLSSYTYSIYSSPGLTSPNSYWSNVSYYVYKIGSPTGSSINVGFPNPVNWTFKY